MYKYLHCKGNLTIYKREFKKYKMTYELLTISIKSALGNVIGKYPSRIWSPLCFWALTESL